MAKIDRTYDSAIRSPIKTFTVAEDMELREQSSLIDRRVQLTNRLRAEKEESERMNRLQRIVETKRVQAEQIREREQMEQLRHWKEKEEESRIIEEDQKGKKRQLKEEKAKKMFRQSIINDLLKYS